MDLSNAPQAELIDLMIRLASSMKEEDLQDPATYGMVSQLVQMMDPKPDPIPQDMVDQLAQINDKAERFKQMIAATGQMPSKEIMDRISRAMKAAGLLKNELAKIAFQSEGSISPASQDREYGWHEVLASAKKTGNDAEYADLGNKFPKETKFKIQTLPVDRLERYGDTPSQPLRGESKEDEGYAQSYAKKYPSSETAEPILASPHPSKPGHFFIHDGRHRSRAAFLRGEKSIRAYVPVEKPLAKVLMNSDEENPFHGWISPTGEFQQLGPDTMHDTWIKKKHGFESGHAARRAGWISIGHAGENNIVASESVINNKRHPAHKKLREMVKEHRPDTELELETIPDVPHSSAPTLKQFDSNRFIRSGTFMPMRKSEPLDKIIDGYEGSGSGEEMHAFHGWISPKGEFHKIPPHQTHVDYMRDQGIDGNMDEVAAKAHSDGWISVSHEGGNNASVPERVASDKRHPAMKTLREMAGNKKYPHETMELEIVPHGKSWHDGPIHEVKTSHFSRYGTIKRSNTFEKVDFKAKYGGPANPIHGWISPTGEYNHMGPDQDHYDFVNKNSLGTMQEAYSKGWISAGHAGDYQVGAHESVISNKNHPATRKLRQMTGEHWPDHFSLAVRKDNKTDDHLAVDTALFSKFGRIKRTDPTMKSEDVNKIEDADDGDGEVSPEEGVTCSHEDVAEHWKNTSGNRTDPDWEPPISLSKHKHWKVVKVNPAQVKAHWGGDNAIKNGLDDHSEAVAKDYKHNIEKAPPVILVPHSEGDYKYKTLDGVHRTRAAYLAGKQIHALVPDEDMAKVDFGREDIPYPQGWVSPRGEFHGLKGNEEHGEWINHQQKMSPEQAYDAGWVSLGHGGYGNAAGHQSVLTQKSHPATRKVRELVGKFHYPEGLQLDVHQGGGNSHLKIADADLFAKYGTIKPSMQKSIKDRIDLLKKALKALKT